MWSWRSFPAASLLTPWCLHSGTEAGLGVLCLYPTRRGLTARCILSCFDQRKKVINFIYLELYLTEAAHPVQFPSPQAASQHQRCVQAAGQSCECLHRDAAHGHIQTSYFLCRQSRATAREGGCNPIRTLSAMCPLSPAF